MDFAFQGINNSITNLHDAIADLHSRQNNSNGNEHCDLTSEVKQDTTTNTYTSNLPFETPLTSNRNPTATPPLDNTGHHKFWKIVRDNNLESHGFQALIKDLTLHDDSMHSLSHFYNKI